jgi:peroxiredoxin
MKYLIAICALFIFTSLTPPGSGYKVGDPVTDFKLKNIDGSMMSLTDLKDNKGAIVIFTCNHCPVSVAYEDRVLALDKEFKPKGYPVVAINPNDPNRFKEDSFDNMKIRAKDKGFTFPYLFDETQEVAKGFGATRTPHVFLLTRAGDAYKVAYIGAIDDNMDTNGVNTKYVERAIDALSKGKKVKPAFTKAVGCTIKWRL